MYSISTFYRNLHDNMFKKVLRTPMTFFNDKPAGRVLNRFSNDLGLIDESLPETLATVISVRLSTCKMLESI